MLAAQRVCPQRPTHIARVEVLRAAPRRAALTCRAALKVGDSLPDFTLETDTGAMLSSKEMVRGHGAVLFVYPQACTSGCTLQASAFRDNIRAFADRGYAVYGMSADPPAAQAGWKAEHGFPFPLLSDGSKTALAALGALGPDGGIKRSHYVVAKGGQLEDVKPMRRFSWQLGQLRRRLGADSLMAAAALAAVAD
ncbi:hypothetical protein GPECTOR_42g851 [Gonium pectorale]|uniref:thioredoxin-dependent peroxiredoxin n=1 Tax=Gonium pectorale TaxID=33097 RepID=A0A150GBA6_GONPE|nr:hypothetical protein GPECTOR_42g851 [Gonium pectorale]|eukprot:KXZ46640.1 hypothetical protein GPECTOR_42g851 [Gonium pectorale]